eukprot:GDKI01021494.1.p1 GENE.GDKI01021494.1~~GDKI01021494.1.p1  ORF type:complete len:120 (-),score=15.98 GDKI01021494.1:366-725(-)
MRACVCSSVCLCTFVCACVFDYVCVHMFLRECLCLCVTALSTECACLFWRTVTQSPCYSRTSLFVSSCTCLSIVCSITLYTFAWSFRLCVHVCAFFSLILRQHFCTLMYVHTQGCVLPI